MTKEKTTKFPLSTEVINGSQEYDDDNVSLGIYGIDEEGNMDEEAEKDWKSFEKQLSKIVPKMTYEEAVEANKKQIEINNSKIKR